MNINVRRRRDAFIGMKAFRQENPDDFTAPDIEATQMDRVEMALSVIESASASQVGKKGDSRYGYNLKGVARENLREEMSGIRDITDSMSYEFPGIDLLFHIPKHLSDGTMLALGKAFHERAQPKKDDFIRYRLKSTFLTDLQNAVDAFEASLAPPEAAMGEQVEATATVGEAVRDGMIGRRILMGVMKAKYKNNPAKWRAWLSASHIDKSSDRDDDGGAGGEGDN
jgi:hypothetical protein